MLKFDKIMMALVNTSLVFPLIAAVMIGYYSFMHFTQPSSLFENPKIEGMGPIHPGDVITVTYDVTRRQNCTIAIDRVATKIDPGMMQDREWILQQVTQTFIGDNVTRPSGYKVQLDPAILKGNYRVFSRVRYYCDALDYIWPRVVNMAPVHMVVE